MQFTPIDRLRADAVAVVCSAAPDPERERLEAALGRLSALHDELQLRHRLLSSGLDRCEGLRQTMLAQLDAITGDDDLEPSLGGLDRVDQRYWAAGLGGDLEAEHDGAEPPEDDEDTLGRTENVDQVRQEFSYDDMEPSLGSIDHRDQRVWADHLEAGAKFIIDAEEQCEDEGGEHDGREPEDYHAVPDYAGGPHDQTTPLL